MSSRRARRALPLPIASMPDWTKPNDRPTYTVICLKEDADTLTSGYVYEMAFPERVPRSTVRKEKDTEAS